MVSWLAVGEDALPAGTAWLAPAEAARAAATRSTKRRTEYLLRRLAGKYAVAGRSADPAALARVEVRNAADGAPEVFVDGVPSAVGVSLTDRAGWAVCAVTDAPGGVGCDLELVEPRSPGFVRDFLTAAEQRFVAGRPAGDGRDLAANLVWSAKESALKLLRTGLRRDTRSVEVAVADPGAGGWGRLSVDVAGGGRVPGWWRRDGRFVLTVVTAAAGPPPVALDGAAVLATATPRHSWLPR